MYMYIYILCTDITQTRAGYVLYIQMHYPL